MSRVVHLVLFRPRPDRTVDDQDALFDAMGVAAREIPTVRGFRIGQHLANPPQYRLSGFPPFPWSALLEFDDEDGLRAYLAHPLHVDLGARFNAAAEAALIYDYAIASEMA